MNQNQFLAELARQLKNLPQTERDNALSYYEEYFRDADTSKNEDVTAIFGDPSAVAAKIIGEYTPQNGEVPVNYEIKAKKSGTKKILTIILAVFAAPIVMPIAIGLISAAFGVLVAVLSSVLALALAGVCIVITGIAAIAGVVLARPMDFGTVVFFLGYSMFCVAAGSAICLGMAKLMRITFAAIRRGISKLIGKFSTRRAAV